MEPVTGSKRASSADEQTVNCERFRKDAEALPDFRAPEIPVAIFLEEGVEAVRAAHLYAEELEAVGMPPELPVRLGGYLAGLRGAQAIWRTGDDRPGRELEAALHRAQETRREAEQASELALRRNPDGIRRLSRVGGADTVPQLLLVLAEHGTIATRFRAEFAAIRVSADELAEKLAADADALQEAMCVRANQAGSAEAKELRDRYYTLTLEPLSDLRAYAQFAFRKDRSARRRQLFLSRYIRERNRKQLRKARAAAGAAPATTAIATASAADDTAEQWSVRRGAA